MCMDVLTPLVSIPLFLTPSTLFLNSQLPSNSLANSASMIIASEGGSAQERGSIQHRRWTNMQYLWQEVLKQTVDASCYE